MNGLTYDLSINGRPAESLDIGGRPSNMFRPWDIEHTVQALGRLADGGDYRASYRDGVLRVETPSGNFAEMTISLSPESFAHAGQSPRFYDGANDLHRSRFVRIGHEERPVSQVKLVPPPATIPAPVEQFHVLTLHNPDVISFRQVVADAAAYLGVRHRGVRPSVETLGAVSDQIVVDIREAERVFVRLAAHPADAPAMFDWRRAITALDLADLQVER